MTMYRYMALMWSRTDREAEMAAKFVAARLSEVSPHAWCPAWDGAGLAIYHSGEHKGRMQTYRLQGERGAVLGRLFRNDYTSVVDDLDEFESRKCLETKGQHLIDDYWGRYVAFLNDLATGTRYVMRDPSGAFPCFYTPFRGVTIHFSDMLDAANLDFLPFTVNWDFLRANLILPNFQKAITGLNEVSEVLPAECVEVTPFERKSRFVWNPTEISQTNVVEHPKEAANLLRETVKSTVGALAGCYRRVVHNLGGLDSSIILACLAQAPKRPEITCNTHFTKSPRGEERHYSRQAAEKYGVELVEWELDYRRADLKNIHRCNKPANPLAFYDCLGLSGEILALAKQNNAEALFYGTGGDNVFYQPPFNLGALDYVRICGHVANMARVAMEASRYSHKSLTQTVSSMLRERFLPAACYPFVYRTLFEHYKNPVVNPDFIRDNGYEKYLHPLLIPNDRDLKGKYSHILMCAFYLKDYYDHWDTEYFCERIRPYHTQPIIEACLRIPVWTLTYCGVERGLARLAFKDDLPHDILRRFSKSTPGEYHDDIFDHNIEYLREFLFDCTLVREGMLSRHRLETTFSGTDPRFKINKRLLIGYVATEAWVRRWINRPTTKLQAIRIAV